MKTGSENFKQHVRQQLKRSARLLKSDDANALWQMLDTLRAASLTTDHLLQSQAHLNLSVYYADNRSDALKSLEFARAALAHASMSNDARHLLAAIHYRLGFNLIRFRDYAAALNHLYDAEKKVAEEDVSLRYKITIAEGDVFFKLALWSKARLCFEQAMDYAISLQDEEALSYCKLMLGIYFLKTDERDKAYEMFRWLDYLRVFSEVSHLNALLQSSMAEIYISRGDSAEATERLERTLNIRRIMGDESEVIRALAALCRFRQQQKNLQAAKILFDELLELAGRNRAYFSDWEFRKMLSSLFAGFGNYQASWEYFNRLSIPNYAPSEYEAALQKFVEDEEKFRDLLSIVQEARELVNNAIKSAAEHSKQEDTFIALKQILDKADYTKVQTINKRGVNLDKVIGNVRLNLEKQIPIENIKMSFGKMPIVPGDEIMLTQLFQNIVTLFARQSNSDNELNIVWEKTGIDYRFIVSGVSLSTESVSQADYVESHNAESSLQSLNEIEIDTCRRIAQTHGGDLILQVEGSKMIFTLSDR